jgi:hypothetical protein
MKENVSECCKATYEETETDGYFCDECNEWFEEPVDILDWDKNIIKNLKLSELQVLNIVSTWYTNGMIPDIIMGGCCELDEIADDLFWEKLEAEKLLRNIKL